LELNITTYLIVCPLIFLAGFLDSIAGGGGLISLPAYLFAGLPPHTAMATNKLSSTMGAITASIRYYKNGYVDLFTCFPSIGAALAGSAIGTSLTLLVNERYLQWLLIVVLPVIAFYVMRKKDLKVDGETYTRLKTAIIAAAISFVLGGYDGFFGPGTGTFMILAFTGLARIEARTSAGNAKLVNLASNISAAIVFLINGKTIIPLALAAGAFSIAGSFLGSGLVIKKGVKILRVFIIIVLGLLLLRIIYTTLSG